MDTLALLNTAIVRDVCFRNMRERQESQRKRLSVSWVSSLLADWRMEMEYGV